jgi:threonine-phosphate decarboxylase
MNKQENMEWVHGGDVYTEGLLKGRELLDFSSNINPLGVPSSFLEHMEEAVKAVVRYPDIRYRELYESLAAYLGKPYIKEGNIAAGNGAAEIIDLVAAGHRRILLVVPSFAEYEESARKWSCGIEYSFLKEDMCFDYEDILLKLADNDALIIGNPNNPNGGLIDKKSFKPILDYCEQRGKTIIIDEAFIEFTGCREASFLGELERYRCLFIIRALTKFFALPGIRLGYGISRNGALIESIRKRMNPWNINCFAETAAKYVLKDKAYIKNSLKWIRAERSFMLEALKNIAVIDKIFETSCNFVLCRIKTLPGEQLYKLCLEKGIAIRRASNFRGLDQRYIRLAIKDRESNLKLLKVFKEIEEYCLLSEKIF